MKAKKTRRAYRRYDEEFKKNALSLLESGRSVSTVASSLGISEKVLYGWRSKAQATEEPIENLKDENKELRKKLKEVERERDILKKALSIFSRSI